MRYAAHIRTYLDRHWPPHSLQARSTALSQLGQDHGPPGQSSKLDVHVRAHRSRARRVLVLSVSGHRVRLSSDSSLSLRPTSSKDLI